MRCELCSAPPIYLDLKQQREQSRSSPNYSLENQSLTGLIYRAIITESFYGGSKFHIFTKTTDPQKAPKMVNGMAAALVSMPAFPTSLLGFLPICNSSHWLVKRGSWVCWILLLSFKLLCCAQSVTEKNFILHSTPFSLCLLCSFRHPLS